MEWGHFDVAAHREWLVTDGHGGYASGTVSSALTRRYHGLLVAALAPPLDRRVLFSKIDPSVTYAGARFDLGSNLWHDTTIAPEGHRYLLDFSLDAGMPVTTYAFDDARLECRIWMDGEATTYVRYTLASATSPTTLALKCFVEDRTFHTLTHAWDIPPPCTVRDLVATVRLGQGTQWYLVADRGAMTPHRDWYYGVRCAEESARGLDDTGDVMHALTIDVTLAPGESIALVASTSPVARVDAEASQRACRERANTLLDVWRDAQPVSRRAPAWIEELVIAADAFIVQRARGATVVAGYHWFGDWGRDTMISLPGLALVTGRPTIARSILTTFASYLDGGMLPNRFPDDGETPEYNTVDASLWFVEAVRAYRATTHDATLLDELFDALDSIVESYARGTRYGIVVDASDGLLRAGEPGVQLTWMDAKVGDWVVTPRIGKPVEINALWYNALRAMDGFAVERGRDPSRYRELASAVRRSFPRFWNEETCYLYDVLDGPDGNDASIRPNAVFAAALPFRALDQTRERAIVARASHALLTTFGLRSLAPDDPAYVGTYGGGVSARDAAYHRGTAWPWLIGPFVRAWINAYGNGADVLRFIEPFAARLRTYGMGTLAEIADGNAPHDARGAIAQAWSVAQVLEIWHLLAGSEG